MVLVERHLTIKEFNKKGSSTSGESIISQEVPIPKFLPTRMHSSRMHTICWSGHLRGSGCVCSGDGGCLPLGCTPPDPEADTHLNRMTYRQVKNYISATTVAEQWRIYIVKFWMRPPPGPNSFNFMHFWGKFGKIVCWRPPPGELAPPPRGNPGSATADGNNYRKWTERGRTSLESPFPRSATSRKKPEICYFSTRHLKTQLWATMRTRLKRSVIHQKTKTRDQLRF